MCYKPITFVVKNSNSCILTFCHFSPVLLITYTIFTVFNFELQSLFISSFIFLKPLNFSFAKRKKTKMDTQIQFGIVHSFFYLSSFSYQHPIQQSQVFPK